jgi:hypothetical protein
MIVARPFDPARTCALVLVLAALFATGCSPERTTEPYQTATEQLLVSGAVDRAVGSLKVALRPGSRVFVDGRFGEMLPDKDTVLPKYTIGAVRDLVLRAGGNLVEDRKSADVVVEVRNGAQSIDHRTFLIGLPAVTVPMPLAGPIATPELALFKRDHQRGVSKVALTIYDAKSGALMGLNGPAYGDSRDVRSTLLLFATWTDQDIAPEQVLNTATHLRPAGCRFRRDEQPPLGRSR